MRLTRTLIAFSFFLIVPSFAFAQVVHQHHYREIDYETYPTDMIQSYVRVHAWLENMQREIEMIKRSDNPRVAAWRDAILAVPMSNTRAMLEQVNAITNNSVRYSDDFDHYSKDYWASPAETLLIGGDCEDIALLKAFALRLKEWDTRGYTSSHLLIGLVKQGGKTVPHAVLEVDAEDNKHYVMNNLGDAILTFDAMNQRMKPLYMLYATGVITFVESQYSLANVAEKAGVQGDMVSIIWDRPAPIHWERTSYPR